MKSNKAKLAALNVSIMLMLFWPVIYRYFKGSYEPLTVIEGAFAVSFGSVFLGAYIFRETKSLFGAVAWTMTNLAFPRKNWMLLVWFSVMLLIGILKFIGHNPME